MPLCNLHAFPDSGSNGGGIDCSLGGDRLFNSSIYVDGMVVNDNIAAFSGGGAYLSLAGGIYIINSTINVSNVHANNNVIIGSGISEGAVG